MNTFLRRGFAMAALLVTCLASATPQPAPGSRADALTPEAFRSPSSEAGVHVWWHWMDGSITREGITKDLEVMKTQGIVQATILNVGLFKGETFGVPKVSFASKEWFAMYRWALDEAARLGIAIGVHNCDGWSSSGGPWIKPEQSMKQYTWTKTFATGSRALDMNLPQPAAVAGLYRDVAVVAYRTRQQASAYRNASVQLQVNDAPRESTVLTDGNPISGFAIEKGDRLVLSSKQPLEFSRVALHLRRAFMWANPAEFTTQVAVETSSNGSDYQALQELTVRGLNHTAILDVPRSTASHVRITVREKSTTDLWIPVELAELELLRPGEEPAYSPSIPHLGEKTSSTKGDVAAVNVLGTDARAIAPADVVMLTDKMDANGRLRWEAPAGTWAVVRFGYTSTGATNAPATEHGTGLECDKMDAQAVEHHFRAFTEKLINEAGPHAGKALKFILVDSWEASFQNWTDRFPAEFEKRRGYSLLPWLPVLTGETVSSARESEAVLYDVRQTIADLIRENYYDRFASLLHARNIEFHAEVIYGGSGYPPLDVLRATQNVDLPMFEFWTGTDKHGQLQYTPSDAPLFEMPMSAAVAYDKPLVGSEAYTGMAHYSETPALLKPYGDRAFAGGLNRMILHSSVHQSVERKPGMTLGIFGSHFNRNNDTWRHSASWLTYQTRIQSLLGLGSTAVDVLYYLGDQLPQVAERNASSDVPAGYIVTGINADVLVNRVHVVNGRLQLNKQDATLLSLPPHGALNLSTLKRLDALVREGAHVYGPKPQRPLSLADQREAAAFRALADRLWGKIDGQSVFTQAHGKGSVHWGKPIGDVLRTLKTAPQFEAPQAGKTDFLFTHRRVGDADIFFVQNQLDQPLDRECLFRVGSKAPEIWDPETGTVSRPALMRAEADRVRLPVRFEARQALLFVFRPGLPRSFITSVKREGTALFPAEGKPATVPQLRFDGDRITIEGSPGTYALVTNDGRTVSANAVAAQKLTVQGLKGTVELQGAGVTPDVAKISITDLRPLSEHESPAVRYFSGEAVYRLAFSVPDLGDASGSAVRLDLGGFDAIAEVTLNGKPLGQFWKPGTPIDVTGLLRRDNELIVLVVNPYRNRFIGDLKQFGEQKTVWTSAPITERLSAEAPLRPSGLFGPITITRVPKQHVGM